MKKQFAGMGVSVEQKMTAGNVGAGGLHNMIYRNSMLLQHLCKSAKSVTPALF